MMHFVVGNTTHNNQQMQSDTKCIFEYDIIT